MTDKIKNQKDKNLVQYIHKASAEAVAEALQASKNIEPIKKKRALRSVRIQTWMYFFLLAAFALFILWLFQFLFFKSAYRNAKKRDAEALSKSIAEKYPNADGDEEFSRYLHAETFKNGSSIIVFRVEEKDGNRSPCDVCFTAEYMSSQFNVSELFNQGLLPADNPEVILDWEGFYGDLQRKGKVSFIKNTQSASYFVYGSKLNNEGSCLYMATPYTPIESTVSVMADQLLIATAVCLALSVIVSYFISNRITNPITEFSRVARKLAQGDYSVRFKGNGYSEIDNLAQTLNYATEEIGKTEQLRRDFLANVSHDLRTPLTMVKAYAELIRDLSGNDEVKRTQHSQIIIDEADRLTSLVDDILDLSKLQAGTVNIEMADVDMSALVKTVLERFYVYADSDGYSFEFEDSGNCVCRGDEKRLEQVVYNLVDNAISHTGDSKKIKVTAVNKGKKVRIAVRDYGKGIAPDELDKVWERYYRNNQSKRNVVGSGIGLSIVKSVLISHNAEFGVDSTLGEGTEFWFELKINRESGIKR